MSVVETGNPSNVTTSLVAAVSGTGPGAGGTVRITTSAPHLFGQGDRVQGSGVGGTTEANTLRFISVIDASHFDMIGTTFVNAWTSGGIMTDTSLTPQIQLPTDGDPASAQLSGLLSSQVGILDRTQFLQKEVYDIQHGLRLLHVESFGTTSSPAAPAQFFVAGNWGATSTYNTANAFQIGQNSVPVLPGDIIDLAFTSTAQLVDASASVFQGWTELMIQEDSGPIIDLANAQAVHLFDFASAGSSLSPVGMVGTHTMVSGTVGLFVYVNGCSGASVGGGNFNLYGAWSLVYRHWRAT